MIPRRSTLLIIVLVGAVLLASACEKSSGDPGSATTPAMQTSAALGAEESHLEDAEINIREAIAFASDFVKAFGTFSPAGQTPGREWVATWVAMTTNTFQTSVAARFDSYWGWTWDKKASTMDVTPRGKPTAAATDWDTVEVQVPAKRYVVALKGPIDSGHYENVDFTVTVGPDSKVPSQLKVYGATMVPRQ